MSNSKKKTDNDLDDFRVKKTNNKDPVPRGGRPNKKKLTNDEIVKLMYEQGFGG